MKTNGRIKARCRSCYWLNWDFITGEYVSGQWFCGLHGGSRVDPDGEQRDLDHRGGCGYVFAAGMRQLRLFCKLTNFANDENQRP